MSRNYEKNMNNVWLALLVGVLVVLLLVLIVIMELLVVIAGLVVVVVVVVGGGDGGVVDVNVGDFSQEAEIDN